MKIALAVTGGFKHGSETGIKSFSQSINKMDKSFEIDSFFYIKSPALKITYTENYIKKYFYNSVVIV